MPGLYTAVCEIAEPKSKALTRARRLSRHLGTARTDNTFIRFFAHHYREQLLNPPVGAFFATDSVRTDDGSKAYAAGIWVPPSKTVEVFNRRLPAGQLIADETFYPALLKVLDEDRPREVGLAKVLLGTHVVEDGDVIGFHPEVISLSETTGLRIDSVNALPETTFEHFTAYVVVKALEAHSKPLPST